MFCLVFWQGAHYDRNESLKTKVNEIADDFTERRGQKTHSTSHRSVKAVPWRTVKQTVSSGGRCSEKLETTFKTTAKEMCFFFCVCVEVVGKRQFEAETTDKNASLSNFKPAARES